MKPWDASGDEPWAKGTAPHHDSTLSLFLSLSPEGCSLPRSVRVQFPIGRARCEGSVRAAAGGRWVRVRVRARVSQGGGESEERGASQEACGRRRKRQCFQLFVIQQRRDETASVA